jgi:hypothetical protein
MDIMEIKSKDANSLSVGQIGGSAERGGVLSDLIKVQHFWAGHSGRAVWGVGLGRLVTGIVGSNPTQGMDVCPPLSVLCFPV